ncbi:MAG TPA: peptide ligase PGM1-related protein, partial [Longimicrobiales bacterium]|nr:peptide ligase PGM1-related protein [Longimicrobiales bacterium]
RGLDGMRLPGDRETLGGFLRKLGEMGGVVEEWIEGHQVESPSVQLRIHPDGDLQVLSTHDQVLGGTTGQVYLGCRFPAEEPYRGAILDAGVRIGGVLARNGALGRFGIDFVVTRGKEEPWKAHAVEINLRMGGTTPPFMALEFLGGGRLDPETGLYLAADGRPKFYYASDNLRSPAYRGLLPDDLLDLMVEYGIHFKHLSLTGVLFFMIGALSQYGKLGITSIGNSPEEADHLHRTTVGILDRATGATGAEHGMPRSLFEPAAPSLV